MRFYESIQLASGGLFWLAFVVGKVWFRYHV
jgi:hypothetical protein